MNFLSVVRSKPAMEPTIGLPLQREVTIVGNIWPAERGLYYRDLRFHFHGRNPLLEVNIVRDLLKKYTTNVRVNSTTFHTQCIIETALIPLIQKKLEELGLKINWITVNV